MRIGLDPFRAQPLHLGAALVALDQLLGRGAARAVARCVGGVGLCLLGGLPGALLDAHGRAGGRLAGVALAALSVSLCSHGGHVTILSSGWCLSSGPRRAAGARIAN